MDTKDLNKNVQVFQIGSNKEKIPVLQIVQPEDSVVPKTHPETSNKHQEQRKFHQFKKLAAFLILSQLSLFIIGLFLIRWIHELNQLEGSELIMMCLIFILLACFSGICLIAGCFLITCSNSCKQSDNLTVL